MENNTDQQFPTDLQCSVDQEEISCTEARETEDSTEETPLSGERTDDGNNPCGETPDVETLIAEAEHRGYLRGRNESISELMKTPAEFEREENLPASGVDTVNVPILQRERISIWDL